MKRGRRAIVGIERLEDRWVPSTTRLVGNTLLVSAQSGALTLTQMSLNQFKTQDSSPSSITYSNIGSIIVTGTNLTDTITVNLNGFNYTGSLYINTGNGNDVVTITSPTAAAINGNTTILTGLGNDTINLNSTATAGMRFGGNVFIEATANGTKSVTFGNLTTPTTVGGTFTVVGFSTVNLGTSKAPAIPPVANVFTGAVTIQDGSLNIPVNFLAGDGDSFGSNVTVNTGSVNDIVYFGAVTVSGNTSVNLGNDSSTGLNDFVYLGQFTVFPLASQVLATFAGNVNILQGSGIASVRIATAVLVGGDLNMNLGEGNNNVVGDSDAPGSNISGSENITCGNGDNNLGLNSHVDGNINIKLGNSDVAGGGNSTFLNYAPGGAIFYHSGNGPDFLDLEPILFNQVWNIEQYAERVIGHKKKIKIH